MKEWTYRELIETLYEDFIEFENDKDLNYTSGQVADRCLYESTVVINQGYTESVIVYTTITKYILEKCTQQSKEYYKNNILKVLKPYHRNKLDGSLSDAEIKELESDIEYVCGKLEQSDFTYKILGEGGANDCNRSNS